MTSTCTLHTRHDTKILPNFINVGDTNLVSSPIWSLQTLQTTHSLCQQQQHQEQEPNIKMYCVLYGSTLQSTWHRRETMMNISMHDARFYATAYYYMNIFFKNVRKHPSFALGLSFPLQNHNSYRLQTTKNIRRNREWASSFICNARCERSCLYSQKYYYY